jgi:D-sedoheptulose 7-phosphate isomerase
MKILEIIDPNVLEEMIQLVLNTREKGGRIFFIGVGGGAGHAGHAVCDFRKLAQIECYSPSDNHSELTARINDEGWDTVYSEWLKISKINTKDMVFVFSVGGGDEEKQISMNLVKAVQLAKEVGASVTGVVGRPQGYTAKVADACLVVPEVNASTMTAQAESFQAWAWHLIISDPRVQKVGMKWESSLKK